MDPLQALATYNAYTYKSPTLTDKELLYGTNLLRVIIMMVCIMPNYTGISTGLPSEETSTKRGVYTITI
jgi:hypothetical protein